MTNNKAKALFLDRDGVINIDKIGYTYKIEDFIFVDGIFDLCRQAIKKGYIIIIVTNQSGIGREYYSEDDFLILTDWMKDIFISEDAPITDVFYSPHHPTSGVGKYKLDSEDRKPKAGMLFKAKKKYNIDMKNSLIIGDKESDLIAGRRAEVNKLVHFTQDEPSSIATHSISTHKECLKIL